MLQKPSIQVLNALASLKGNNQFETILQWMEASLQDLYRDSSNTKDEVLCRWQQGAAQAVSEILEKSKDAEEVIRKLR
mgnify:CR=1 FL=1|tara:strand:- start:1968 stop:2201 length:234 start_codon:yes stop_codon:yes gene_type:complete